MVIASSSLGIAGKDQQAAKPSTNPCPEVQGDLFPDAPISRPDGLVVNLVKARRARRKQRVDDEAHLGRQVDLIALLEQLEQIVELDPRAPSEEVWTDGELEELRFYLLAQSLDQLADTRVARNTKIEIIDWMMTEGEGPFTFDTCVLAEGCEPDDVRLGALRAAHRITGLDCTALITAIENR